MQRILFSLAAFLLFAAIANAQQTTAVPVAPATAVTDSSGNLLLVERRAASSLPGAAPNATGLVTRVVIVQPTGAPPSSAVYGGTISNFYLGKRGVYGIFTTLQAGKVSRSLVALDAGGSGVLPKTLPSINVTHVGSSDIRVVPAGGNKDAIYIIQQPSLVRRPSGATTTTTTTTANSPRSVIIVEFDGTSFSTPKTVTVQ